MRAIALLVAALAGAGPAGTPELGDLKVPAERLCAWRPGVDGGVPDTSGWPVLDATRFGARANDLVDDTKEINAAIGQAARKAEAAAAGRGAVVFLPAGVYRFSHGTSVRMMSGVVLRGAGAGKTVLAGDRGRLLYVRFGDSVARGGWGSWGAVHFAGGAGRAVNVTSARLPRGTATVELADAAGLRKGDFVFLRQIANDPAVIQHDDRRPTMTHVARVAALAGRTVTLDRPLRHAFQPSLGVRLRPMAPIRNAGIEHLKVMNDEESPDKHIGLVAFSGAVCCWARGVHFYNGHHYHATFQFSARNTVEACRFQRLLYAERQAEPDNRRDNYAVGVGVGAADNLVTDNAFVNLFVSVVFERGAGGNVFSYNYLTGRRGGAGILFHGRYPHANLVEGNDATAVTLDNTHGRQGPRNTAFRNRLRGTGRFRTEDDTSLKPPTIADRLNVIANTARAFCGVGSGSYDDGAAGDFDRRMANLWAERNVVRDTRPPAGRRRWGLVERTPQPTSRFVDNHVGAAAPAAWRKLRMPASLYLTGPPSFWPKGKPWPALGADVDDFAAGKLTKLPAQHRQETQRGPSR